MLQLLALKQGYYPRHFELRAIGWSSAPGMDHPVREMCAELEIPHTYLRPTSRR